MLNWGQEETTLNLKLLLKQKDRNNCLYITMVKDIESADKIKSGVTFYFLIAFCLFFIGAKEVNSQSWIKPGQTWEYYVEWFGAPKLMLKYVYTDDTLFQGRLCQRIKRYQRDIDNLPAIGQERQIGEYYTYNEGERVFYFVEGHFHLMFDLAALPGDSWLLFEQEWNAGDGCDSSMVVVDSIGTLPFGNEMLKWISVHPTGGGNIALRGKIVQNFGAIGHFFLFTSYNCSGNNDSFTFRPMCYSDPEFGTFQYIANAPGNFLPGPECDFFEVGIEAIVNPGIKIFPQPAVDIIRLTLTNPEPGNYQICDLGGRKLKEGRFSENSFSINVSDLPAGIFFIRLLQNNLISNQKIVLN